MQKAKSSDDANSVAKILITFLKIFYMPIFLSPMNPVR